MQEPVDWVAKRLGYRCADAALVEAAFTHRSAEGRDNERLEFLGDAVLSFVVADLLYREFPHAAEGELSRYRATLVSGEALADVAERLELGQHLRLGAGELRSGGFRRRSILADALEALIGAIFLDGGPAAAREVVERLLRPQLPGLPAATARKDPKTHLQEWLQGRGHPLPVYQIQSVSGEPHEQSFRVSCEVEAIGLRAEAVGPSRRRAEQAAGGQLLGRIESGEVTR